MDIPVGPHPRAAKHALQQTIESAVPVIPRGSSADSQFSYPTVWIPARGTGSWFRSAQRQTQKASPALFDGFGPAPLARVPSDAWLLPAWTVWFLLPVGKSTDVMPCTISRPTTTGFHHPGRQRCEPEGRNPGVRHYPTWFAIFFSCSIQPSSFMRNASSLRPAGIFSNPDSISTRCVPVSFFSRRNSTRVGISIE